MIGSINSEKELIRYITSCKDNLDAIVVEGYDGVGKGRVLEVLSGLLSITPYRPDYNLWDKHDHRYKDRWKVSGFFWDVYSHFTKSNSSKGDIMLFDRGVLSGAVYAHDQTIALDYKSMLRDMHVLHILVVCDHDDYKRFYDSRGKSNKEDFYTAWEKYKSYTDEYFECFNLAGVPFISYKNHFSEEIAKESVETCEGCGHYNHGYCRHPALNCKVEKYNKRCSYSGDMEAQDVTEMLSM